MDDYKIKNAMYLACHIIDSVQASLCTKKNCIDKFISLKQSYALQDDIKASFDSIEEKLLTKLQELSHLEYQVLYGKIVNLIKPEKDIINQKVLSSEFISKCISEYETDSKIHIEIAHPQTLEMNKKINTRINKILSECNIIEDAV